MLFWESDAHIKVVLLGVIPTLSSAGGGYFIAAYVNLSGDSVNIRRGVLSGVWELYCTKEMHTRLPELYRL